MAKRRRSLEATPPGGGRGLRACAAAARSAPPGAHSEPEAGYPAPEPGRWGGVVDVGVTRRGGKRGLAGALAEAEAAGVLPLTSTCNISCVFCSNRWNPPGLRVFRLPPRSLAEVEAALAGMSHLDEVVIGESASRVLEGEPLTHPDFGAILRVARRLVPQAVIKVTTNGLLLDAGLAGLLADLGPVEVTLSLNTASPEAYRRLHGIEADPARAPGLLRRAGIPFHGSVVAVPALAGRKDLTETVRRLEAWGALSCRVFVPGHTSLTPRETAVLLPGRAEVAALVEEARGSTRLPLTLDPPEITDLAARLAGVIPGSPADRAGLRAGDVLTDVEGTSPVCRVDAFRRSREALARRGRCRLEVAGRGPVVLSAGPGRPVRTGLVMDCDVDPADAGAVRRVAAAEGSGRVLILTSTLASGPLRLALASPGFGPQPACRVTPVPSTTFGGSIGCAGLLTVADVERTLAGLLATGQGPAAGEVVLLPRIAFDRSGVDLVGRSPAELRALLPPGTRLVVPGLLRV